MWTSAEESAALRYLFVADGGYAHAGVLVQDRIGGRVRFAVTESGYVRLRGRTMVLTPTRAHQTIEDSEDPTNNFDKSGRLRFEVFGWSVKDDQLLLTNRRGAVVTYARMRS